MLVKVNGEFVEIEKKSNIEDLLVFLDIPKVRIAVELNDEAVPTPASTIIGTLASSPEEGTID